MENIEKLIQDTLKLFPEEIDISDGELRNDNGFFSQKTFQSVAQCRR